MDKEMTMKLMVLMRVRRDASNKLPANTMRHDQRLDVLSEMDVEIRCAAKALGMTELEAWKMFESSAYAR